MDSVPGSPFRHGSTIEEELAYYKAQYEQLEVELQDFQASSRELEAELEKDVEASEKRERKLKEQVEGLGFEVDEWKSKYKQSKTEANTAQTTLQKEITTMRETNRTLQLKLRDIEVANDDYERQARNTSSSLEDLESKYNVAIERGVMLEEEIRAGEQERETLRIETQRLRDELSDLRIEADITMEKLRLAEANIERLHEDKSIHTIKPPTFLSTRAPGKTHRPVSPASEATRTTTSSPTVSTPPPAKSEASTISDAPTPPTPPLSDSSALPQALMTKFPSKRPSFVSDSAVTPRPPPGPPGLRKAGYPGHNRAPSFAASANGSTRRMAPPSRPPMAPEGLPRSSSLYQIKGLIGRMQKIEERVHNVRSKLPPRLNAATPRGSPRASPKPSPRISAVPGSAVPASVTMRRTSKRISSSSSTPSSYRREDVLNNRTTIPAIKRLSFGVPQEQGAEGPATSTSRPDSRTSNTSHPSSRASTTSHHGGSLQRPPSRSSGARTPLGLHSAQSTTLPSRPRSSLGGNYATAQRRHAHSMSLTESHESDDSSETPAAQPRRMTLDRSSIPTPSSTTKRQSGGGGGGGFGSSVSGRRPSGASRPSYDGTMPPPTRKLSDLGETY